jgi:hypothetical protein
MRASDWAFLVSHMAIAALVAVMWTIDDAKGGVGGIVRQSYLWLLVATQAIGVVAGLWQGRSGSGGRVRTFICAASFIGLMGWWVFPAEGFDRVLVVSAAAPGTAFFLGPAVAGVAVGAKLRQIRQRDVRLVARGAGITR